MIDKIIIRNYKCIKEANIDFNDTKNIIVGNNGVGKSTLMEALSLVLGYGLNKFEITPYIFNIESLNEYDENKNKLPEILIEVYFTDDIKGDISGENNSLHEYKSGLYLKVKFNELYNDVYNDELRNNENINLPCEYYCIERMWFSQLPVVQYKMPFSVQIIDSTSLYFSTTSNQYINHLIEKHLGEEDTIKIKTSLRHLKETFDSNDDITSINQKINESKEGLSLSVDVTSRIERRDIITPFVNKVPVSQIGAGDINHLKTLLALSGSSNSQKLKVVILEEPENHLSHTKMYSLLKDIEQYLSEEKVQIFITTHNSFVANKMNLKNLIMLENSTFHLKANRFKGEDKTYKFFSKVCHYPTLRMILSKSVVLVEGPADELVTTYYYYKNYQRKHPFHDSIELIVVGGTMFKEYVNLLGNFDKKVAIITDNDGMTKEELQQKRGFGSILPSNIQLFTEEDTSINTLEPSFVHANLSELQSLSDFIRQKKVSYDTHDSLIEYMKNHKTEWSYKLLQEADSVDFLTPKYISEAIKWITE